MVRFVCMLAFAALTLAGASAPVAAKRVVSLNLCSDLLVMMLADREDIAAVTWLAADPADSPLAEAAAGLTLNYGTAEEVLLLDPDVVVAARYARGETVALLRRMGREVVVLDPAASLDDIRRNVRIVGEAVGEPERADRLIAAMDARLTAIAAMREGAPRMLVAVYLARGFTVGAPSVIDDLLGVLGLTNLGADVRLQGMAELPAEALLVADPDVLIVPRYRPDAPSLATAVLDHPALDRLRQEKPVIAVPTRLWDCGTPLVAEAAAIIAEGLEAEH